MKEGGTSLNKTFREYNLVFKGLMALRRKLLRLCFPSLNRSNSAEIRSYSTAFPPMWVSMNSATIELNAVATSRLHYNASL